MHQEKQKVEKVALNKRVKNEALKSARVLPKSLCVNKNMQEWSYLSVVTDGEPVIINGANEWDHEWKNWDIGTFEVPHPNYPSQKHKRESRGQSC